MAYKDQVIANLLNYYSEHPNEGKRFSDLITFLKTREHVPFPYDWIYDEKPPLAVHLDEVKNLLYIDVKSEDSKIKRLYYPSNYKVEQIKKNYAYFQQIEQHICSPHRYLTPNFEVDQNDVVVDGGASIGDFSLNVVDKVKFVYIFEPDDSWHEALNATFEPYKDKIKIIKKFISNKVDGNSTTIDYECINPKPTLIKLDIEGFERDALLGAQKSIENVKKLAICTYHKPLDFAEFSIVFDGLGYRIEPTGYSLVGADNTIPFFRQTMIRCTKEEKGVKNEFYTQLRNGEIEQLLKLNDEPMIHSFIIQFLKKYNDYSPVYRGLLARAYREGRGVPKDENEAVSWMRKACDSGGPLWTTYELFDLLWKQNTVDSCKEMIDRITPLSNKNDPQAMLRLARAYREGRGVQYNLNMAAELMKKSAESNIACAKWEYFDILWNINNATRFKEMIAFAEKESNNGNMELRARLARVYKNGRGVSKDLKKAAEIMKKIDGPIPWWYMRDYFDIVWLINEANYDRELIDIVNKIENEKERTERLSWMYRFGRGVDKNLVKAKNLVESLNL